MLGFSKLLQLDENINTKQKKYVDYINKSGKRLLTILSDILEISSIEAGQIKNEYQLFKIEEVINDISVLFENALINKNIKFSYNLNGIKEIFSDPARIRQILFNLVGNALKFTSKGKIKINIDQNENDILFEVQDSGIGIEDENKKIIFDMFKQVESAFQRQYQGAGLGLAICKKLVEALGGKIWVRSKVDKGSSFYFTIPLLKQESQLDKKRKI